MGRSVTLASVLSVPVVTLAGSAVSLAVGAIAGIGTALVVGLYLSSGSRREDLLDVLEKLIEGEHVPLEGFDQETASRLLRIAEKAKSKREVRIERVGVPEEVREALEELRNADEKATSLLESTDFEVSLDSNGLLTLIQDERSRVAELGDYIQTLTAGIEEMNTQAQALTDYALETANMAEKGKQISDNVALNVASINEVNQDMEKALSLLVEHSKRVGEIVEVIGNIAEQTNLLALNAAIEAARSGEHGRGFAVVAENIRELADQSKKSTDQIAELIRNMQESIDKVVGSIKKEFTVTEEIKDAVQELIAAFDDIARRANETANMIKELSDSIEGQAQSVQMLMDTLDSVYKVQEDLSTEIDGFTTFVADVQTRLEEIRKGLKELAESVSRSRELLERVGG
ncbi:methyl-accepting chemotaxis protein [Thermococcus nautili]|uniref:Methyl-accepting chemotaxis protein n=1 Tax=Thermococcus nautili TaxID=195522 RepID=W8P5M2_9EURY|nr:methyl-accepting chemotaxis protein [Thermococcus nautili]AHL22775.1 Methyl-accepting chemotaxis protein [Thermococcus nautili]CAI1493176.1 Methyl-accepting chemotaxis protein [Thermococcus nautili]